MKELLLIDAALTKWARYLPSQYHYDRVVVGERSESVFSEYYHVYKSILAATLWNNYRCIRILVNQTLVDEYDYLSLQVSAKVASSRESQTPYAIRTLAPKYQVEWLARDICASVPSFLGYKKEFIHHDLYLRAIVGNLLIWPLYNAGITSSVSNEMRMWLVGRLEKIADVMGIEQCIIFAGMLRSEVVKSI